MTDHPMDDDMMWLDAALDDELDMARSLALQERLARDPAFRAAWESRRALRASVREQATRHAAPAALHAQFAAMLETPAAAVAVAVAPAPGARRAAPWWNWLGGVACGALAASLAMTLVVAPSARGPFGGAPAQESVDAALAAEAVSAHTRSLLVGQAIEVASSDQHTVRPWLSARLNFVPPIVDLAQQGFPLIGARRDVVAGQVAATLVYKHGAHLVSAFVQPVPDGRQVADGAAPVLRVVRGFNVLEMTHGQMQWRLVSDMNPADLGRLAELLSHPAPAGAERS